MDTKDESYTRSSSQQHKLGCGQKFEALSYIILANPEHKNGVAKELQLFSNFRPF